MKWSIRLRSDHSEDTDELRSELTRDLSKLKTASIELIVDDEYINITWEIESKTQFEACKILEELKDKSERITGYDFIALDPKSTEDSDFLLDSVR